MVDIEYANACTELLEILQYLNKEDYDKIPNEKINSFMKNENSNYHFHYNPKIPFENQDISEKTKYILANLFCEYWANDKQKEMIKNKRLQDHKAEEDKKCELYNTNNIFKNKQDNTILANEKKVELVPYQESIIKKIIKKITKFFKKIE